jgi:hypothetical protein
MAKFAGTAAKTKKTSTKGAKLPVLGKFAMKDAKTKGMKFPKAKIAAVSKDPVVEDGEFVGLTGRVSSEDVYQIFGIAAKIIKQTLNSLFLKVGGDYKTYQVPVASVEILEWLLPASTTKSLQLNQGEKAILLHKFPELCSDPKDGLTMGGRLSGDHLLLQAWVTDRDLMGTAGAKFVAPVILYQFTAASLSKGEESLEIKEKAGQVLLRKLKKAGLLGLPIYSDNTDAEAHWTLLVLRKSQNKIDVRYYDSLPGQNVFNTSVADDVLSFMRSNAPEFTWPESLPDRSNTRSRQANGIDCGVFVMWYWEGELRQWIGEGWSLPFPTTSGKGTILKYRERLVKLSAQMQKLPVDKAKADAKALAKAKGKPKAMAKEKPEDHEVVQVEDQLAKDDHINSDLFKLADLKKMALKTLGEGSVPFYGCSRCRYSRGGCINIKCHPDKFQVHFAKHPEMYKDGSTELTTAALKSYKNKDLTGGGSRLQVAQV